MDIAVDDDDDVDFARNAKSCVSEIADDDVGDDDDEVAVVAVVIPQHKTGSFKIFVERKSA